MLAANKFTSSPTAITTTVMDDTTACMSPEQITNYMSNVGIVGTRPWARLSAWDSTMPLSSSAS